MKICVIKTSSMGDIIHALPALTDAAQQDPTLEVDWVVEKSFAEIPLWHAQVKRVIPVALRQWRKNLLAAQTRNEWREFLQQLRAQQYDYIIDAQGLLKSATLSLFARGLRIGLNWRSAWESLASLCYQQRIEVAPQQHAVTRMRQLFAGALHYPCTTTPPDYGIEPARLLNYPMTGEYVVFIHGTSWDSKQWPETYWIELAKLANQAGFSVYLPWGNNSEKQRAEKIAATATSAWVLPALNLSQLASVLLQAKGAVAVDTGLGHLAAALSVPTVSLYGPTDPKETGTCGQAQMHLTMNFPCAPCQQTTCNYLAPSKVTPACYSTLAPAQVWQLWLKNLEQTKTTPLAEKILC